MTEAARIKAALLIVLAGLPATGKSTIARALAERTGGIWLRIDSIEQAIRDSGVVPGEMNDAGYRAAQASRRTTSASAAPSSRIRSTPGC